MWEREAFCFFVNQFSWGTIWHAKEWTVDALSWQVWRRYLHRAVGVLGASGSTCSCVLNHSKIANVGWLDPGHLATSWDETAAGVLNVNLADSHADFSICVIYIYTYSCIFVWPLMQMAQRKAQLLGYFWCRFVFAYRTKNAVCVCWEHATRHMQSDSLRKAVNTTDDAKCQPFCLSWM